MSKSIKKNTRVSAVRRSKWMPIAIVGSLTLLLCLTINYRTFAVKSGEVDENQALSDKIQNLTDENLALQEEIHRLKSDPKLVAQEAKRLGIDLK